MHKLTFVSTFIPYPPDKNGFTENIFYIIRTLKEKYQVYIRYIAFFEQKNNETEKEFSKYVDELIFEKPTSKYFFPVIPFKYKKYKECHTVFFCDFNAGYYQSLFLGNKILYSADSPTFYYSKRKDLKSRIFYWKFLVEEIILFPWFKKIIFVSELDAAFSKKRTRNKGIQVPIGYNAERSVLSEQKEYDLIFSGNFNYKPNHEAAELFLLENAEKLITQFPKIKLCFVGRNPSQKMKNFAEKYPENIVVTGEVISVEEYLGKSRIFISPLQSGSGMKNKILQAMAAQLPVIGTTESLSGFSNYNPESVRVVHNIKDMMEEIELMYNMPLQRLEHLGKTNQEYFEERYSWNAVVKNYYSQIFGLDEN
jgi:glycosyltransferase involved in cell wall biosynthesis